MGKYSIALFHDTHSPCLIVFRMDDDEHTRDP